MHNQPQSRIELRVVEPEDAELLFRLMTTDQWLRYVGERGVTTKEDAKEYILRRMHRDLKVKGFVNHVIKDTTSQTEVGTCSLHNRPGVDGLDIGYAILEEYEGKGFATAGAKEMVNLAFNNYQIDKVSAVTIEDNIGSCRVLEKLGFQSEGFIFLPNDFTKLKLYVIYKENWQH
ncbi:MAG: GNAT family N-acetyltransferase [Bacteroidia bacterium]